MWGMRGMRDLQMLHNIFQCSEMLKFRLQTTRNILGCPIRINETYHHGMLGQPSVDIGL